MVKKYHIRNAYLSCNLNNSLILFEIHFLVDGFQIENILFYCICCMIIEKKWNEIWKSYHTNQVSLQCWKEKPGSCVRIKSEKERFVWNFSFSPIFSFFWKFIFASKASNAYMRFLFSTKYNSYKHNNNSHHYHHYSVIYINAYTTNHTIYIYIYM